MVEKLLHEDMWESTLTNGNVVVTLVQIVWKEEKHVFIPPQTPSFSRMGEGHGGRSTGRQPGLRQEREPYDDIQDVPETLAASTRRRRRRLHRTKRRMADG